MKPKISAVILTLNEEKNIAKALRSVTSWVDEIILVDMHSDDRTVEIAECLGARVYQHPRVGFVEPARCFAMEKATGDWIIHLDADELIPYPLSSKLLRIAEENQADVYTIPRLNYISGSPLLHTGWGADRDRQWRFFKKDHLQFSPRVHGGSEPVRGARVRNLMFHDGDYIVHFCFFDTEHILQKLNRYTTIEAEQAMERNEKASLAKLLLSPVKEFIYRFLYDQGFRDGWRGFYCSAIMAGYRLAVIAKLHELEINGIRADVISLYDQTAERILSEYPAPFHNAKLTS